MDGQETEEKKPRRRAKKARAHKGHHGGAWKVAYADFVTAMMALFLVLWLVSQADIKVKQAIANYFRAPGVFDSLQGGILSQAKKVSQEPSELTSKDDDQMLFITAQKLKEQFSTRPEFSKYKDQVKIEITDEGLRIQLIDKAERVSFPSASAELTPEAQAILTEIASGICTLPNKINIGGHTDSHIFGTNNGYTNWELSTDRANAARRVLETVCVKPEQIHRIVGFADTEPMDKSDPFAPANRRISITVLRLAGEPTDGTQIVSASQTESGVEPQKKESPKETLKVKVFDTENKTEESKTEIEPPTSPEAETDVEKRETKAKLANEGSVNVGTPDEIPPVPKSKENN